MKYFEKERSIVKDIWGKSDTILLIFAGAAAEFALNKAVDWLYFTGRLPNDPLKRFFSTVSYARIIVFSEKDAAIRALKSMSTIHKEVEAKRGDNIPDWAYRDVLFMLIDYSIRSYELVERKLSLSEKQEIFEVFHWMGTQMQIADLPETFEDWEIMRIQHLHRNLQYSQYTTDLFNQYQKHLGTFRYKIMLEVQSMILPLKVCELLFLKRSKLEFLIGLYKLSRSFKIDGILKSAILPSKYRNEFKSLDN